MRLQSSHCLSSQLHSCSRTHTSCAPSPSSCTGLPVREVLHVRILHPAGDHALVTQVVDVLQQHHPHHHPDRNARMAFVRAVVLRELRLHRLPVNLLGQKDQLVVHVNETLQCDFKDGHLMLLGGGDHFASIICRFLTSI